MSARRRASWWSAERRSLSAISWGLASLCLVAPLLIGGAPAWALSFSALGALMLGLTLLWERGRLSPALSWLSVGYLISALGGLISLLPLTLDQLSFISPYVGKRWRELSDLLNSPLEGHLTLTPAETWAWLTLELSCVLAAYVAAHTHRDRRPILSALALIGPLLTLLGALHALLGLEEVYGLYQSLDREALRGFVTPMINLNHAASLMSLSALISLGLGLHTLRATQREGRREERQRSLSVGVWFGGALVSAFGVMLSGSRAASVALLIGGGVSVMRALKRGLSRERALLWTRLGALSVTALCVLMLVWGGWSQLLELMGSSSGRESFLSDPHAYPRLGVWRDTLLYIREHALWGSGRGSFGEVFMSYQSFATRLWASSPESHPLQQLAEGGLLGLIGGVALPFMGWCVWWRRSRGEAHEAAFGLWVGLGVVGAHQLVDFGFEYAGLSLPVAIAWGVLWSYLPSTKKTTRSQPASQAIKLALMSLLLLLGVSVWRQHHSASWRLRPLTQQLSALTQQGGEGVRHAHQQNPDKLLRDALKRHPASAHLALFGVLSRASEASDEELSVWLKYTRARARHLSSLSQLEARRLRAQGFPELAALSYHRALNEAPWRFKELASELIETGAWSLTLLAPKARAPFIRLLRDQRGVAVMLEALNAEREVMLSGAQQAEREARALRGLALTDCGQRPHRHQEPCRSLINELAHSLQGDLTETAPRLDDETWWSLKLDAEGAALLARPELESLERLEGLERLGELLQANNVKGETGDHRAQLHALVRAWRRRLRLWAQPQAK